MVAPPPVPQRTPLLVSGHPFAFIQEEFVKRAEDRLKACTWMDAM